MPFIILDRKEKQKDVRWERDLTRVFMFSQEAETYCSKDKEQLVEEVTEEWLSKEIPGWNYYNHPC